MTCSTRFRSRSARIAVGSAIVLCGWLAALAVAGDALAASSAAKPVSGDADPLAPVWAKVERYASGFLEEPQQKQLYELSFAAAVPAVCPSFRVDEAAIEKGFLQFDTQAFRKLPLADQRKFEQKLIATYGVGVGLLMADGSLQPERFCATAEEARDKPSGRSRSVTTRSTSSTSFGLAWLTRASASATTAGPTVGSPTGAVPRAALPPSQAPAVLAPMQLAPGSSR